MCHKAPVGYLTDALLPGGLRHDPQRAPLIRHAFELYASGNCTKASALASVTALGLNLQDSGKPVSVQTFNKILRNPVYAGWIVSDRWELMQRGKFEPIIESSLFDRVQQQLTVNGDSRCETRSLRHDDFPLRVFVRCSGCGKGITGSFATGRKRRRYPYYTYRSAGCRAVKFSRNDLHQKFIRKLYSLGTSSTYMPLFRDILERVWKQKTAAQEKLRAQAERRLSELESRKRKLLDAMLEGCISKSVYEKKCELLAPPSRPFRLKFQSNCRKSNKSNVYWILPSGYWTA